ncbi:hypothetical protein BU26DRAFT_514715 [Trematosphaeria pertusa]|uniref:Uncharacterized protein n=1 Tax=Trematosphaeria pertusa TaxID=390896 RepID=A0A6A6IX59_9PLEO|nr:uncharacterized protein BU26DRAFT_514715 [Trematosphaeria pertusa]KAF2254888.1 hypothetical protein BU26DRAFT_514715 [Trematosphaeria pertusa]
MRFNELFVGALSASLVDQPEVTTTVTRYLAATTTVTVGFAPTTPTPAAHLSPVVSCAPAARPPPGVFNSTASVPQSTSGTSLLSAIGQWASEPLAITPWQIFLTLSILASLSSFAVFVSRIANRFYLLDLTNFLLRAAHMNCMLVWTLIIFALHYLAYQAMPIDPMNALVTRLALYEAENPTLLVMACRWATKWWRRHFYQGYGVLWAVWLEVGPGIEETGRVLLRRAGQMSNALPNLTERALDGISAAIRFVFWCLGATYAAISTLLSWVWAGLILPTSRFLKSTALFTAQKLYPARYLRHRALRNIQATTQGETYALHHRAANLSLHEIVSLYDTISSLQSQLATLEASTCVTLAQTCLRYRSSLLALISDVNWYRRSWDAVANYLHNTRHNINPSSVCAETPYRSSRIVFLPTANAQGFHFDIDPATTSRLSFHDVYTVRGGNGRKFRTYAFNSGVVNAGLVPRALDLFQSEPWGFDVQFPGIRMPRAPRADDLFDMKRRVPMPVAEQQRRFGEMMEDVAAKGRVREWEALRRVQGARPTRAVVEKRGPFGW